MAAERSRAIDELATEQHGLVTTDQAVAALGRGRKQRWVVEGRLVSMQPGVLRVAGAPRTWHQSVLALELATEGVVSHRSAAEVWGLIQPAGYVEVSVTPDRAPRSRPPAIVHRIADLDERCIVEREGLRLTEPVRTVIDLGLVLPAWSVSQALSRGLTTKLFRVREVQRLRDALGRQGRNGTGVMRQVLEERLLTADTEESILEARFVDLLRRAGLPLPSFQHQVWHAGRFVARVDAAYAEAKLAIEVDGFEAHSSPEAFQRDRARQNRLVNLGWTVLRFTWSDVVKHPTMVASTISQALARLADADTDPAA